MKAEDYLKQLSQIDIIIQNKIVEKSQWMDIALGITAQLEGDRVQSSSSKQKMAEAVNRCIELEEEINALIDHLIDCKQDIIKTIEKAPPIEYDVLHKRYIQNMGFKEIGTKKGKSKSWATTVHGRALLSVQRILDEREKHSIKRKIEILKSL